MVCQSKQKLNKRTPLHWAAKRGNVAVARFLLENGADLLLKSSTGENAFDVANPRVRELFEELKVVPASISAAHPASSEEASLSKEPAFVPSYISHPDFFYSKKRSANSEGEKRPQFEPEKMASSPRTAEVTQPTPLSFPPRSGLSSSPTHITTLESHVALLEIQCRVLRSLLAETQQPPTQGSPFVPCVL